MRQVSLHCHNHLHCKFEDCEEQDGDVDVMQTEKTAPMLDMDAAAEKIISIDKYKNYSY